MIVIYKFLNNIFYLLFSNYKCVGKAHMDLNLNSQCNWEMNNKSVGEIKTYMLEFKFNAYM